MPTLAWQEEKAENAVRSICQSLQSQELPDFARIHLSGQALCDALKLLADAIEQRLGGTRWSTKLVHLFIDSPDLGDQWIEMMKEPGFDAEHFSGF